MSQENAIYRQQTDKMQRLPRTRLVRLDIAERPPVTALPAIRSTGVIQPITEDPLTSRIDDQIRKYLREHNNRLPNVVYLSYSNKQLLALQGFRNTYRNIYGQYLLIPDLRLTHTQIICA